MGSSEAKFEAKTVRAVRGTESRAIKKWEAEGWEVTARRPGKLHTELDLRRPKPRTPWLLFAGVGSLVAVLIVFALVMSIIQGEGDAEQPSASSAVESSDELTTDSASASPEESTSEAESSVATADDVVTPENDIEFAELLTATDTCSSSVASFASEYAGRTVQFDANIGAMGPHGDYDTRYDILIGAGEFSETEAPGPAFQFRDVNMSDLKLTGNDIPDTIGVGDNLRVTATVDRYIENQCLFLLEPVQTEFR